MSIYCIKCWSNPHGVPPAPSPCPDNAHVFVSAAPNTGSPLPELLELSALRKENERLKALLENHSCGNHVGMTCVEAHDAAITIAELKRTVLWWKAQENSTSALLSKELEDGRKKDEALKRVSEAGRPILSFFGNSCWEDSSGKDMSESIRKFTEALSAIRPFLTEEKAGEKKQI